MEREAGSDMNIEGVPKSDWNLGKPEGIGFGEIGMLFSPHNE